MSVDTPEQARGEFRDLVTKARMARKMVKVHGRRPYNSKTTNLVKSLRERERAKKLTKEAEDIYGYSESHPYGE